MHYLGFRYATGMPTFPKAQIPVFGYNLQVSHMTHRLERYFLAREIEHCGFTYPASTGERKIKRECKERLRENVTGPLALYWRNFPKASSPTPNLLVHTHSFSFLMCEYLCACACVCELMACMHEVYVQCMYIWMLCVWDFMQMWVGICVLYLCEYVLCLLYSWGTCVRWGGEWGI